MAELTTEGPLPLVSIIIATYNRAGFIAKAIESVLDQTLRDFELIVIDDGSTDDTRHRVAAYEDGRIIYERIEHGERSRARNIGIQQSRSKYIAFLDSDDWYLPEKLALQVAALEKDPSAGLVLGGWHIVDERGALIQEVRPWEEISPQPQLEEWLFGTVMTPITMMVRREWLERAGGFDNDLAYFEDVELCIRLATAGCPVAWVREPVAVALVHQANSLRNWQALKQGQDRFLTTIFTYPDFRNQLMMSQEEVRVRFRLALAWRAYHAGFSEQGMQELAGALGQCPSLEHGGFEAIKKSLVAYANYYLVSDPIHFVERVFQGLPPALAPFAGHRRDVLGRTWMSWAWRSYRQGKPTSARQGVWNAMRYTPGCLKDRGVRSLLFQSIFGRRVWQTTRSILHWAVRGT